MTTGRTSTRPATAHGRSTTLPSFITITSSAMARTTALTTSSVAHWVAEGGLTTPGVWPLERIARDAAAYRAIVGLLREKEIQLQPAVPFID